MKVLLVLIMSIVAVVSAGSCPTMKIYGQPNCLPKSEYHPYWQRTLTFTSANGPCFKKGSGQPVSPTNLFFWNCLVNEGEMVSLGHRCASSTRAGWISPVNALTQHVVALPPMPHSALEPRYIVFWLNILCLPWCFPFQKILFCSLPMLVPSVGSTFVARAWMQKYQKLHIQHNLSSCNYIPF